MKTLEGKIIGDIHISVCQTSEGNKFFELEASSQEVTPVLDVIEDTLSVY